VRPRAFAAALLRWAAALPPRHRWSRISFPSLSVVVAALAVLLVLAWLAVNAARTPARFAEVTFIGLSVGAVYAVVALGYTLVYGILETINFAHGDVFIFGAMIAASVSRRVGLTPGETAAEIIAKLSLMFAAAVLVSAALNGVIELVVFRPLREAPRLAPLVASIGAVFVLENALLVWQGDTFNAIDPVLPQEPIFRIRGVGLTWDKLILVAIVVGMLVALHLMLARTRQGRAMRAVAQDREAAALMGVSVNRTIFTTFVLSGALAGGAGFLYLAYVTNVSWDQGFRLGLIALTAAVLGGIGNVGGAVLGAAVLGLASSYNEGLAWHAAGSDWTLSIIFLVLIALLVLRPRGLLGEQVPVA
jgi:branched-chain amino acid transport system permease protein